MFQSKVRSNRGHSSRLNRPTNPPASDPQQTHSPSKNHWCDCGDSWGQLYLTDTEQPCRLPWGSVVHEDAERACPSSPAMMLSWDRSVPGQGALRAMSCSTNLSPWTGSVIKQNIQKAFLSLPRGKELCGLQPRAALSPGGKLNVRRKMCGWRAEGAKQGAEAHGKPGRAEQDRKLWTCSQKRWLQFTR